MGKLQKSEEGLGQIKEKNIQLSDELLSKSRQLTALENRQKDEVSEVCGLKAKVADLTSKLSKAATTSEVGGATGGKKKSVSFAVAGPSSEGNVTLVPIWSFSQAIVVSFCMTFILQTKYDVFFCIDTSTVFTVWM